LFFFIAEEAVDNKRPCIRQTRRKKHVGILIVTKQLNYCSF